MDAINKPVMVPRYQLYPNSRLLKKWLAITPSIIETTLQTLYFVSVWITAIVHQGLQIAKFLKWKDGGAKNMNVSRIVPQNIFVGPILIVADSISESWIERDQLTILLILPTRSLLLNAVPSNIVNRVEHYQRAGPYYRTRCSNTFSNLHVWHPWYEGNSSLLLW